MSQTQTSYDPDRELERLYASITGRAPFSYSPGRDPLYRSYAAETVQNGRLAMRDTVGRSAALTGGYGSSYAQSAGQQQFGEYLRALGEAMPEFYGRALERYRTEQDALRRDYDLARERRDDAYQRERDALADRRYEAAQSAEAERQAQKQNEAAYERLYKLISTAGYEPNDEELAAAGLNRAQAEALLTEYLRSHKLLPGQGGGRTVVYVNKGKSQSQSQKSSSLLSPLLGLVNGTKQKAGGGGR